MKKKYIMLINRIGGMGGGQMYVNNKLSFVSSLGWQPMVFFAVSSEIVISDLRAYEKNVFEKMILPPMVYSKKTVDKVIAQVIENIGDYDEAVIETGCAPMALWGEILAKKLNCKHMVHLLDEHLDKSVPVEYLDFYKFKHGRGELSGINSSSLKILFRNSPMITDNNAYYLSSLCSNVVLETENDILNIPKEGISLGCIGRLNKEYVDVVAKCFYKLALKYQEKYFNIVFIGGSEDESYKNKIADLFSTLSNVNLIMSGALYPIPSATLKKITLFVSSAGSARVSYGVDIPTISIDTNDLKPIGVLGYTTHNSAFRKDEPAIDLNYLMEQILFNDYLKGVAYTPAPPVLLESLKKHIDFLERSDDSKEFFDIDTLQASKADKKKHYLYVLCGPDFYLKLRAFLRKAIRQVKKGA